MKEKLPKGIYYRDKNSPHLWIAYTDEQGKRIKESAKTADLEVAQILLNKRLREVSEGKLTPTKKFESITFGEIFDFWWERHG